MAFESKGTTIIMDAYDFGIQLPIVVEDGEFETKDTMLFEIKKSKDSLPIFTKEFENESINANLFKFFLEFTKKESEAIPPGNYVYYIRYLKNGEIRDTLIPGEDFKVKSG